jgi:streptomycin 6-kinase
MDVAFKGSIPQGLINNVLALCGKRGEEWLDELPQLVKTFEQHWSITVDELFPNVEYNFVASATGPDGARFVLKIAPPLTDAEIYSESKYLRSLDGDGAVKLFREHRELRAILMERAVPGRSLKSVFDDNEPEAVRPSIDLLQQISRRPPNVRSETISLDDWFDGLRRYPGTDFPAHYAAKALRIYERLFSQAERIGYLHGDFHPDNIVSAQRTPFLVIDPKGIVGHIGYEIAVFLNNFHWWQEGKRDIRQLLDVAVRQFSDAFDIDPYELRQWAFAQMVLSAWWMFDEMSEIYDNEVVKADIWDV